jgi:hypothetical protein
MSTLLLAQGQVQLDGDVHGARGRREGKGLTLIQGTARAVRPPVQGQEWAQDLGSFHLGRARQRGNHGGETQTIDEMFDPQHQGITGRTLAALVSIGRRVTSSLVQGNLARTEPRETCEYAEIGLAWASAICEESGQDFAGCARVPRSYYDIKGRPDEDAWYAAADKELTKLFDMGTFEIVETSTVPEGTKIMETVFAFKRKEDSKGKLKELRCLINADGRQQEKGSGVCLLLQDLVQSCLHWGGGGIWEDMCYERRRAEACVD